MEMENTNGSHGVNEQRGRLPSFYQAGGGEETVRLMLQRGSALLQEQGVPNARLNAEWILCGALECTRMDLFLGSSGVPDQDRTQEYWRNIRRRAGREPLQYILEATEFMSLPFRTPVGVFVPRPDTEVLVELTETRLRRAPIDESLEILDICCGTGAVAVSLAVGIPNLSAFAVDVSEKAIEVATLNAELNGVSGRVHAVGADASSFLRADGSFTDSGLPAALGVGRSQPIRYNAIVCNPPYIASSQLEYLPPEVRSYEPRAALDGGDDGLDFYRTILPLLPRRLKRGGFAAFEIGDTQGEAVSSAMKDAGFVDITVSPDYAGRDRVVIGNPPATSD